MSDRSVWDAKYHQSEKGQARALRYAQSPKGREARRRASANYRATTPGILTNERAYQRRMRGEAYGFQD